MPCLEIVNLSNMLKFKNFTGIFFSILYFHCFFLGFRLLVHFPHLMRCFHNASIISAILRLLPPLPVLWGGASYVVGNCTVLGGWQLHCTRWLASVWPGGSVSVFPPCLCGQGRSLLWKVNTANPDTFVATFSIDLQHFPYFCNKYWRLSERFG